MAFRDACIPVRFGWSSPFARWKGPLAELSSIDLAVEVTARALADRGLPVSEATGVVFGWDRAAAGDLLRWLHPGRPHRRSPRLRAMLSQACATSAACLEAAALRVDAGLDALSLVITTDRTSNGPVLTWPAPSAPGGAPRQEHWVLDSFRRDPRGGLAMVASEWHGQAARTDAQRTNRTGNSLANGGSQLSGMRQAGYITGSSS
jgi:acetyl-CoA acetyltransferase